MSEPGQGAAPAATPPAAAAAAGTPWHGNDFAQLVTAKGWASADDALKSYQALETHLGAPADRLLRLPDKPDAAEWGDIRARVGWKAPEKPEDYGIQPAEGYPPEYASMITTEAHKLGIPKDALVALAKANDTFIAGIQKKAVEEEGRLINERITQADAAMKERFGDQAPQMQELMLREAVRLGIKAEEFAELEKDLAANDRLGIFRALLADVAEARKESPLHQGSTQRMNIPTPEQAQKDLEAKRQNPEWAVKAMQRGTAEAEENIRLNGYINGIAMADDEVKRLAKGLSAKPGM